MLSIILSSLGHSILRAGAFPIGILTIMLSLLFVAAWKAPSWTKEIGIAALVISIIFPVISWIKALDAIIQCNGEIAPTIVYSGLQIHLTVICYGLIIYLISLILRVINKPRI